MVAMRAVCAISHSERLERSFTEVTECSHVVRHGVGATQESETSATGWSLKGNTREREVQVRVSKVQHTNSCASKSNGACNIEVNKFHSVKGVTESTSKSGTDKRSFPSGGQVDCATHDLSNSSLSKSWELDTSNKTDTKRSDCFECSHVVHDEVVKSFCAHLAAASCAAAGNAATTGGRAALWSCAAASCTTASCATASRLAAASCAAASRLATASGRATASCATALWSCAALGCATAASCAAALWSCAALGCATTSWALATLGCLTTSRSTALWSSATLGCFASTGCSATLWCSFSSGCSTTSSHIFHFPSF